MKSKVLSDICDQMNEMDTLDQMPLLSPTPLLSDQVSKKSGHVGQVKNLTTNSLMK